MNPTTHRPSAIGRLEKRLRSTAEFRVLRGDMSQGEELSRRFVKVSFDVKSSNQAVRDWFECKYAGQHVKVSPWVGDEFTISCDVYDPDGKTELQAAVQTLTQLCFMSGVASLQDYVQMAAMHLRKASAK